MKLLSLIVVKTDDWECIYNQYGHIVQQDHTIRWEDVLSKNVCRIVASYWYDGALVSGYFPDRFSELNREELT